MAWRGARACTRAFASSSVTGPSARCAPRCTTAMATAPLGVGFAFFRLIFVVPFRLGISFSFRQTLPVKHRKFLCRGASNDWAKQKRLWVFLAGRLAAHFLHKQEYSPPHLLFLDFCSRHM